MSTTKVLKPFIVSAPFGNYLGQGWATRTLGTFTLHARPPGNPTEEPIRGGRLWRILKTVRYNPFNRSWRNKIGLRNPGILSLFNNEEISPLLGAGLPKRDYSKDIISIHGFQNEWMGLGLLAARARPLAIEFNLSCPNVEDVSEPFECFQKGLAGILRVSSDIPTIVKLPPPSYGMEELVEKFANPWYLQPDAFHCCNTIPTPKGGISGKVLKPFALRGVRWLREKIPHAIIIGGGGVSCREDAQELFNAGANCVAIASCLFNPLNAFFRMPRLGNSLYKDRDSIPISTKYGIYSIH